MKYILWFALLFSVLNAADKKAIIKNIKAGEVELSYYIRGEGKPLVMINGFRQTLSLWDPGLLEELESRFQLILFDNRGIGFSTDTPDDHTTIQQMADDTAAFIKALGHEKTFVLGWSMGAMIGQQLAIRHPDVVEKLILCAPNPGGKNALKMTPENEMKLSSLKSTEEEKLGLLYPDNEEGKKAAQDTLARLNRALANGSVPKDYNTTAKTVSRQAHARGALWQTSDENYNNLSKIKAPTLLTDGKLDIIDLPGNVPLIAAQIPFAWVAYFDGGHAFLFQDYKKFAALVTLFLSE